MAGPIYYCSVEGNIAAGKSTLLRTLAAKNLANVAIWEEPVELYNSFGSHHPLDLLYSDPSHEGAVVQLHIIQTMAEYYDRMFKSLPPGVNYVIMERSMLSSYVFILLMKSFQYITDFQQSFLVNTVKQCLKKFNYNRVSVIPGKVFYIGTDVHTCTSRAIQRARNNEATFTDLEPYLSELENKYAHFLEAYRKKFGDSSVYYATSQTPEEQVNELLYFITQQ